MAWVQYVGPSDTRELSAKDFDNLGAPDAKKQVFVKNEPTEVDDATADVLLNNADLAGEFEEAEAPSDDDEVIEPEAAAPEAPAPDAPVVNVEVDPNRGTAG